MKQHLSTFFFGVVLALICVGILIAGIYLFTPTQYQYKVVTPIITVIPAPIIETSPTVQPDQQPTASSVEGMPPDPGAKITIGATIHITGTGGEGLRLRREPGKNGTPIFLGAENEAFEVKDGPQSADGYTWWYLQSPTDSIRAGWAVSNYLAVE